MSHSISITIDVADLASAIDFYTKALSCELKTKHSDDWAELTSGGTSINVLEKPAGSIAAAAHKRNYDRHWTPVHIDFSVEDVADTADRVKQHNGVVEGHVVSEDTDFAHCSDPFGNGFCLVKA